MAVEAGSLTFWKPTKKKQAPPADINDALQSGDTPVGLADLPLDKILAALEKQYPALERTGDTFAEVDIDEEQTGIEMSWGPRHVRFDFFGDAFGQMEAVAKLMAGFGCSCYSPDEKKLFPPDAPPKFTDPEFDGWLDNLTGALRRQADAAGDANPQAKLKRMLDFMKSGDLEKELGKPPLAPTQRPPPKRRRK